MGCLLILVWLWLWLSSLEMARSLRWWQARQLVRQSDQAKEIRDGVLQESFALWRNLELVLTNSINDPGQIEGAWLNRIETMQHSLAALSNHLAPPYVDDHLPLAVRSRLEHWHQIHPTLTVETILPQGWCQESGDASQILLMALDELLQITLPKDSTPITLSASLCQHDQIQELLIRLSTPELSRVMARWDRKELNYLRHSFYGLTSGHFFRQSQSSLAVVWQFRWRSRPSRVGKPNPYH
jgi:hypothetical protein